MNVTLKIEGETPTMLEHPRTSHPVVWASLPALVLVLVISACTGSMAQTQNDDVPILVAAEDEDPTYLKRSNDIFRRTIANLKSVMRGYGFAVVDEDAVAVDWGWKIKDRRNKSDLIELAKDMALSDIASHRVRALVMFRVRAILDKKNKENESGRPTIFVRIAGEIVDTVGNRAIDAFELPRQKIKAPGDCNDLCISEIVGDRSREIAGSLGGVLAKQLARYRSDSIVDDSNEGSEAVTGGGEEGKTSRRDSGQGLLTTYTVTLEKFSRIEALTIIGTMADEFPYYRHHELMRQMPGFRKYGYTTSAKQHKLEEWLSILLRDMNFNVDTEIEFVISGTDIRLYKIVPTHDRPRSEDEERRFK